MVFDLSIPHIDVIEFGKKYWDLIFYGNTKEDLPKLVPFEELEYGDMSQSLGHIFWITVYVDCNLGADCIICGSRIDYFMFLNNTPDH